MQRTGHRVYRGVKSAIDYPVEWDDAFVVIRILKIQRRGDAGYSWNSASRSKGTTGGHGCTLSRLTSLRVPRIYLHFGARDATVISFICCLVHFGPAVYMHRGRWWRRYIRLELCWFLVNFNERRVNANARAREYPPSRFNGRRRWCRSRRLSMLSAETFYQRCVLMPLRIRRFAWMARSCRNDSHQHVKRART